MEVLGALGVIKLNLVMVLNGCGVVVVPWWYETAECIVFFYKVANQNLPSIWCCSGSSVTFCNIVTPPVTPRTTL